MNKLPRIALLTMVLCGVASVAHATAILIGSVANNGQIVGPNDTVTIRLTIQNTGDTAFASNWSGATIGLPTPAGEYSNSALVDFGASGLLTANFSTTPLAPGNSVTFNLIRYTPLIGGADPGLYSNGGSLISFNDGTGVTFSAATWQVVDAAAAAVPEPATLSLLGLGLAGLVAGRSRRKRS